MEEDIYTRPIADKEHLIRSSRSLRYSGIVNGIDTSSILNLSSLEFDKDLFESFTRAIYLSPVMQRVLKSIVFQIRSKSNSREKSY